MDELTIRTKLDELANLRSAVDAIALQKQELIASVLTDEIKAKLADIDAEFVPKLESVTFDASTLENEIRLAILEHGASVKGSFLQAIWMKGRVTWDSKLLDGYALAHPEISILRKVGEPTVSLRGVK